MCNTCDQIVKDLRTEEHDIAADAFVLRQDDFHCHREFHQCGCGAQNYECTDRENPTSLCVNI